MKPSSEQLSQIQDLVKREVPDEWETCFCHYQKLGKGERYSFKCEKKKAFEEGYRWLGVFVTCPREGDRQVVIQDETSLEKEYQAVRHSMEAVRKDSSTYFNVLITLLSASIVGVGFGNKITLIMTGIFIFLLFLMNMYFKQVLFAKRLRLRELEKVLGFEQLTIVGLSQRTWLVKNTPYLTFGVFIIAYLAAIFYYFFNG